MEKFKCKICDHPSQKIFNAKILDNYTINYYQCPQCEFIQTEHPFWLDEAYTNPIGIEDVGILKRNILFANRASAIISSFFDRKGTFIDYGGGFGIFVRLMRDIGYDFYWSDPYCENILSKGFEATHEKFELLTSFECFEHFSEPITELEKLLEYSANILFSTETFKGNYPKPSEWDYYSFSSGQHIALYSQKSLQYLADKYNLYLLSNNKSFHLFTKKRIPPILFKILLKLSRFGFNSIPEIFIKSKTLEDMRLIIGKNK